VDRLIEQEKPTAALSYINDVKRQLNAVEYDVLVQRVAWSFYLQQKDEKALEVANEVAARNGDAVPLAAGFGVQVALYMKLREVVRRGMGTGSMVAASGTTSTAAMISCCAHYLVNVAPVLGATGLVTFAAQYQVEFFWVGLAFNAAGIAYVGSKLAGAIKDHAQCATP
ncbi:MAG: hypothetical protein WBO23_11075, partial [Burkholderiales bacterium]